MLSLEFKTSYFSAIAARTEIICMLRLQALQKNARCEEKKKKKTVINDLTFRMPVNIHRSSEVYVEAYEMF